MPTLYLSIGSNIDPTHNFQICANTLTAQFHNIVWSPIYQSPAIGLEGNDFLNAVVSAETSMSAMAVNNLLKQIELNQGRDHSLPRFSSRTLDIDLLLYDQLILKSKELTLPREEIYTEAFVLLPLVKLAPELHDPASKRSFQSILDNRINDNAEFIADFKKFDLSL